MRSIRFIRVPDGAGKERLVWYMIYHVKNNGEKPFLFIPRFELQSHDVQQTYAEKILPDVIPLIRAREDKNRRLLSTTEITGEMKLHFFSIGTRRGTPPGTMVTS